MWYNFNKRLLLMLLPPLIRLAGFQPPSVAAVSGIIINKKGKLLTIDLAYKKGLSLPGGAVNAGESLEDALKRELKEETNLDLKTARYLGSSYGKIGKLGITSACFECTMHSFKGLTSSTEGEVYWENPRKVFETSAYRDVAEHIANYFGFKKNKN